MVFWQFDVAGLIPAYAGSTLVLLVLSRLRRAHPRLRGEHGLIGLCVRLVRGSSPLTRGARCGGEVHVCGPGLIPAYAGSTFEVGLAGGLPGLIPAYAGSTSGTI